MSSPSSSPSSALAIEATGLVKRYGDKTALGGRRPRRPPRLGVRRCSGPNGAGKTTAVRVLTTLTEPDEGSARVAGHDVVADPVAVRRSIGLAAQDATVDGLLTGRENLVMIGELHHLGRRRAKARADELLEQFTLTDAADRVAKDYSGGMRRRLDLAATLVARPGILFLDEPTTGLDPRARNELWAVLDRLVAERRDDPAHDAVPRRGRPPGRRHRRRRPRARHRPRRLAVAQARGRRRPAPRRVRATRATSSEVAAIVERVAGARPSLDLPTAQRHRADRRRRRRRSPPSRASSPTRGIAVEDLGLRQPTLDDVFLTLTGAPAEADAADPAPAGGTVAMEDVR